MSSDALTPWVNTSDWPDFLVLYPDTLASRALHSACGRMTDRLRYIVLDPPSGGSIVISLWDPVDLDSFLTDAMPIVESFEFDLSQLPSASPS